MIPPPNPRAAAIIPAKKPTTTSLTRAFTVINFVTETPNNKSFLLCFIDFFNNISLTMIAIIPTTIFRLNISQYATEHAFKNLRRTYIPI